MKEIKVEIGKRLDRTKGKPKQVFLKVGEQRIGSVLLFGDNPGKDIRLNEAGRWWIHELMNQND